MHIPTFRGCGVCRHNMWALHLTPSTIIVELFHPSWIFLTNVDCFLGFYFTVKRLRKEIIYFRSQVLYVQNIIVWLSRIIFKHKFVSHNHKNQRVFMKVVYQLRASRELKVNHKDERLKDYETIKPIILSKKHPALNII